MRRDSLEKPWRICLRQAELIIDADGSVFLVLVSQGQRLACTLVTQPGDDDDGDFGQGKGLVRRWSRSSGASEGREGYGGQHELKDDE